MMPVAPYYDLALTGVFGLNDLATEGCRGLFTSAVPGAMRPIYIVESGDGRLESALGPVFLAEHLGHEFFPAIPAFGHGGIGVRFLQGPHIGVFLQLHIVGTGR